MNKFVIFAFNGNPMCFIHVLLNALDMDEKGMEVKVVIEDEAVKVLKEMVESNNPYYKKFVEKN